MSDLIAVKNGCLEQFDGKARNKVELHRNSNSLLKTRDSHETNALFTPIVKHV